MANFTSGLQWAETAVKCNIKHVPSEKSLAAPAGAIDATTNASNPPPPPGV